MATRGSGKWFSEQHESRIARYYGGHRSPSSGASITDAGDVRTSPHLFECKHTGSFTKPAKSISIKLTDLEKIVDEAYSEGRTPVICLSIYNPDSILSDDYGFIDITARLTVDDIRSQDGV